MDESEILLLPAQKNRDHSFPGICFYHDDAAHWKKAEELDRCKENFIFKKVIFQVRDPRDVVVSNFFEKTKRLIGYINGEKRHYSDFKDRIEPYAGTISDFIREPVGSFDTIIEFYNIWAKFAEENGDTVLLLRYEDMKKSIHTELRRVLDFMGMTDISEEHIDQAVEYASFQKMQDRERKCKHKSIKLSAVNPDDPGSYKARKGKVGSFLEELTEEDIKFLNEKMKQNLSPFFDYSV